MRQSLIKMEGTVIQTLKNTMFKVLLDNNLEVFCYLSGNLRQHFTKVLAGDRVTVELASNDLSSGRITCRLQRYWPLH
jgi:translation initiation factor IF-1